MNVWDEHAVFKYAVFTNACINLCECCVCCVCVFTYAQTYPRVCATHHYHPHPPPQTHTVEHPVYEAFFNTVNAWSLMFLPVILHDRRTQSLGERTQVAWWLGIFFVTNVFFVPYLAIRAAQPEPPHTHVELDGYPQELPATTSGSSTSTSASTAGETIPPPTPPPTWAPAVGITGFLILSISAAWLVTGRPEFGGWDARWEYVVEKFNTDRVFWAFVLDCGLYSVWQAMLVGPRAAPAYRFVPFVGLAAWLCAGMPEQESKA